MSHFKNFQDLEIYNLARVQCQRIWNLIQETELKNDYKLRDQINASSGSVMDNIAEGFGRGGNKEFIQFLAIARGSNNETMAQLQRAYDRKHISEEDFLQITKNAEVLGNQISKFLNYLKASEKRGSKFNKK
ncbi:four helix bundle protein [Christiangramia fulva]|uniref:Four helix bundle protein n=1 Tax=Christiangramia fulva TaxID=2126553 RepID=A0A2R3Z325_9FLAO|nr:four helix bundle protein [Christiangramia fulva]AVR44680.1 four helix bundle protein [Christiangramia fulva]